MSNHKSPKKTFLLASVSGSALMLSCVTAPTPKHAPQNKVANRGTSVLSNAAVVPIKSADEKFLDAQNALQKSFDEVSANRFVSAQEAARTVLNTEGLSRVTYRWAIASFAMAKLGSASPGTWKIPLEFSQSVKNDLLESPGWAEADISKEFITSTLLGSTLRTIAKFDLPTWWKELSVSAEAPKAPEDEQPTFEKMKRDFFQKKFESAQKIAEKFATQENNDCASRQFAKHVLAQSARRAQNRKAFFERQEILIRDLEENPCSAEKFAWTTEKFDEFIIDAHLWLARLQWERGENELALNRAQKMLTEAVKVGNKTLAYEAAHVTLGRVGLELFPAEKNVATAESLLKTEWFSERARKWLTERLGLFQMLAGQGEAASKTFETLANGASDNTERALYQYWKARSQQLMPNKSEALATFASVGEIDPHSYADLLAGNATGSPSGRASTAQTSAFPNGWGEIYASSVELSENQPFKLFKLEPELSLNTENTSLNSADEEIITSELEASLRNARIITNRVRALSSNSTFDEFRTNTRKGGSFLTEFLRAETRTLQKLLEKDLKSNGAAAERFGPLVAWHMHLALSDAETILFIGKLRDKISLDVDPNKFLYLLFYPRPYFEEFAKSAARCNVDVNIMYGISRQESLFSTNVKSPVGAVGLMQLLPSTAKRVLSRFPEFEKLEKIDLTNPSVNSLAGACYIADLISRYKGNLYYAIAAYNAGENAVDNWIEKRAAPTKTPEVFVEFIPFNETKKYVEKVFRNYNNMRWIYGNQTNGKSASLPLKTH